MADTIHTISSNLQAIRGLRRDFQSGSLGSAASAQERDTVMAMSSPTMCKLHGRPLGCPQVQNLRSKLPGAASCRPQTGKIAELQLSFTQPAARLPIISLMLELNLKLQQHTIEIDNLIASRGQEVPSTKGRLADRLVRPRHSDGVAGRHTGPCRGHRRPPLLHQQG